SRIACDSRRGFVRRNRGYMRKLLLLFLACFPAVSYATLISFNPDQYRLAPGSTLKASIIISALPAGLTVGAYDLTVDFDPSMLTYDQFIFSNFFGNPGSDAATAAILRSSGRLEATLISLLSAEQLDALQS